MPGGEIWPLWGLRRRVPERASIGRDKKKSLGKRDNRGRKECGEARAQGVQETKLNDFVNIDGHGQRNGNAKRVSVWGI